MKPFLSLTVLASTTHFLIANSHASQSPYLKEIITGRCYSRPPSGKLDDAGACPSTVGSVLSVLESNRDDDIFYGDFDYYIRSATFDSKRDEALFRFEASEVSIIPSRFVTPEGTPGGALLDNLLVCGIDRQQDCDSNSNAMKSLWTAVYAQFAKGVSGRVCIVVGDEFEELRDLFHDAVVSKLDTKAVSSALVYARDCRMAEEVVKALTEAGIKDVSCEDDWVNFFLCQDPVSEECQKCRAPGPAHKGPFQPLKPGERPPTTPEEDTTTQGGGKGFLTFLVAIVVTVIILVASYMGITVFSSRRLSYTPLQSRPSAQEQRRVYTPSRQSRPSADASTDVSLH